MIAPNVPKQWEYAVVQYVDGSWSSTSAAAYILKRQVVYAQTH
jgi:hypothetical protein